MIEKYIFTVTVGRSGQSTLYDILQKHSYRCLSAFEAPNIIPNFTGFLGDIEKRFRRKFIETDELLGRGKILRAFEKDQHKYIEYIAKKRIMSIEKQAKKTGANIYFDISKFYARGIHIGFNNILEEFSLVFLVRDPLLNMISFVNRNKNFFLDNSFPENNKNMLQMDSSKFDKGEFYLWSWSEMLLRYKNISCSSKVKKSVFINTDDLLEPKKISKILENLGVSHSKIDKVEKKNTNVEQGFNPTLVKSDQVEVLRKFISKIPSNFENDLEYLNKSLKFHEKNLKKIG